MGKYDIALNLVKKTTAYVKACGKSSLLETKPTIFHGINPTLSYAQSGKSFTLPRFISEEMIEARNMNKLAIQQLKNPKVATYSKATVDDLTRLTDESFEACEQRAVYTNPKDGKVYNLLSEGKTSDGLAKIRILDEEGAYLKTVEVKPSKVVIIDDFVSPSPMTGSYSRQFEELTHGETVALMARRTNPFADYELIDMTRDKSRFQYYNLFEEIETLQRRIDAGEKIDILSLSIGRCIKKTELAEGLAKEGASVSRVKTTNILKDKTVIEPYPVAEFAQRNKGNVRVLQSAGNWGKGGVNFDLLYADIEGVGALTPSRCGKYTGKITGLSASRNSLYTQHYEQGLFPYTSTSKGLSLFGGKTTELRLKEELKPLAEKYIGKVPNIASPDETKLINQLKKQCQDEYSAYRKTVRGQCVTAEEENRLQDLYQKARLEKRNKTGIKYQREYKEYEKALNQRVNDNMVGYEMPSLKSYQEAVNNLEQEGKVLVTCFSGEFSVPSSNPLTTYRKLDLRRTKDGILELSPPHTDTGALVGTSFSTPVRAAKLALKNMLEGVL